MGAQYFAIPQKMQTERGKLHNRMAWPDAKGPAASDCDLPKKGEINVLLGMHKCRATFAVTPPLPLLPSPSRNGSEADDLDYPQINGEIRGFRSKTIGDDFFIGADGGTGFRQY